MSFSKIPSTAIVTFTGKTIKPLDPDPELICIEDIAHSLSNQCRWTGHTKEFYSTAQHSVLVSEHCTKEDALWGLLHDASEAYICDIPRPVKSFTEWGRGYRHIERMLMKATAQRFDLIPSLPLSVREADDLLLYTEMRDLMPEGMFEPFKENEVLPISLRCWTPSLAEIMFLTRFEDLING